MLSSREADSFFFSFSLLRTLLHRLMLVENCVRGSKLLKPSSFECQSLELTNYPALIQKVNSAAYENYTETSLYQIGVKSVRVFKNVGNVL